MSTTLLGLSPEELRVLEGLTLSPRRTFSGSVRGERLSKKRGISIDFRDFREYSEGDDLRHLDWNILARHETPILKTYRDEEDLNVMIALDCSASMAFGEPSKFSLAQRLALALGFVALNAGDTVSLVPINSRRLPPGSFRGRPSLLKFAQAVKSQAGAEANLDLGAEVARLAQLKLRKGLLILITDGLHPDFTDSLKILGARGHEVWLIQVLASEEMQPDIEGDLRLIDCESGDFVEVTANRTVLRAYEENLQAHLQAIRTQILTMGGRSHTLNSGLGLVSVVRDVLLKESWLA